MFAHWSVGGRPSAGVLRGLPRRGTGENGTEAGKEKRNKTGGRGDQPVGPRSATHRARRAAPGFPGQRAAGPWGTWPAGPARDPHTATSATPPPSPRRTATSSARRPMRIRRPSLGWLVRPPTCGHRRLGMFVAVVLCETSVAEQALVQRTNKE